MTLEIERLSAAFSLADAELQRQQSTLCQLQRNLLAEGPTLNCAAYMELQARVAQETQRVEVAKQKASQCRAALDAARSAETDREQKQIARRRYDAKQAEFQQAENALNSHRQQLAALSRELPSLEQRFSISLRELAEAKECLNA